MKISSVKSIRPKDFPNLIYLHIITDEGIIGLGETFLGAAGVEAHIHEVLAPYLLDKDPLKISLHHELCRGFLGTGGSGTENRARSAVDVALWDILGKETGKPLIKLLGGGVRDKIQIYNTCAGPNYAKKVPIAGRVATNIWQIPDSKNDPYEDLQLYMTDAGKLAKDLLKNGVMGMKIWPFDEHLDRSNGHWITNKELEAGLKPFRQVREAVGNEINLMADIHTNWDVPNAVKIARALKEYNINWVEDPVRPNVEALTQFRNEVKVPLATGETMGAASNYLPFLQKGLIDYMMFDPIWLGGITECLKAGAIADAHQIPVSIHDCNGPVNFTVGVNLSMAMTNACTYETARGFYYGWYHELLDEVPLIDKGFVSPLSGDGLGIKLKDKWLKDENSKIIESKLS